MKNSLSIVSILFGLLLSSMVFAYPDQRTVTLPGSYFWVQAGETRSLQLNGWQRVKKIYVQAMADSCATQIDVIANGDTKGTIYLPARDPSYVVTIEETVNTIEFRNYAGCNARIIEVKAIVLDSAANNQNPTPGFNRGRGHPSLTEGGRQSATQLCARTIELVDMLENSSDASGYVNYLLPIKKAAARAYAVANARAPYHEKVARALEALQAQIDTAYDYLDNSFERKDAFDAAVELLGLREKLEAMLH